MSMIPLFSPDMPTTDDLIPYLREIDCDHWYSNFGPKLNKFETLLAAHFQVSKNCISTSSSATTGLMMALKALTLNFELGGRKRFRCLLPAWTFVASAQAVLEAGGLPLFCDVSGGSGALTPEIVEKYLSCSEAIVPDVVMAVAPFGAAVEVAEWDAFSLRTGIPVVIDAAASFFSVVPGIAPVIVSLHATKVFGVGEGGVIISQNASLIEKIHQISKFGFSKTRVAIIRGGNYKLSEYHAAVGLAQFERLSHLKARYLRVKDIYLNELSNIDNISVLGDPGRLISSTLNVLVNNGSAKNAVQKLRMQGIGASIWWEDTLHRNPVFMEGAVVGELPVSDDMYDRVFGLPFHSKLTIDEIRCVLRAIRNI